MLRSLVRDAFCCRRIHQATPILILLDALHQLISTSLL